MSRVSDDGYRESIWGIDPKESPWFQLLTLTGGIAGSVILTWLELNYRSGDATLSEVAQNIVLGISASFIAAGFIVWGILQAKDLAMPAGDVLRGFVERRREKWRKELLAAQQDAREEGRQEGLRQGREEVLREIYGPDYSGSQEGTHHQPPDSDSANGTHENDVDR